MMVSEDDYYKALAGRIGKDEAGRLRSASVGIAGLGGLGSNIAMMLARSGIGRLVIADHDTVELTNIHRQCYPLDSIGMKKTDAVVREINRINPFCKVEKHDIELNENNLDIFSSCDIVCEAFDSAENKIMLIEGLSAMGKTVISGNGMAGKGPANTIITRKVGDNIYICGDGVSDVNSEGSLVPSRVTLCAAHQANAVIRIISGLEP
jgi:sulfur carrier protein ThiS adenylyltransferase